MKFKEVKKNSVWKKIEKKFFYSKIHKFSIFRYFNLKFYLNNLEITESQYSKRRIQYGVLAYNISVNSGLFCCTWLGKSYSGVSAVGDDDYEVRLWKLIIADPIWRSQTRNSINFEFSYYDWIEKNYSGIFEITEYGCEFRFWKDGSKIPAIYAFSCENYGFWSDNLENYYSSVWGITKNLIRNLNSAIENMILRSHTWFFKWNSDNPIFIGLKDS